MTTTSSLGLKLFDWFLRIAGVVLLFGTALFVVLIPVVATGHGEVTLPARVEPPFTVAFEGEDPPPAITMGEANAPTAYVNFPIGEERTFFENAFTVNTTVTVDDDDADTRAVAMIAVVVFFALLWLALINLRRIVRDARAGDPFDARNANRLRWLAAAVVGLGVAVRLAVGVMDVTLDEQLPVQLNPPGPSLVMFLAFGLGLLALAEVFRAGSDLRDFERATI